MPVAVAHWKSPTTVGLPVLCSMTPTVILPLLIPGPVHGPAAVVAVATLAVWLGDRVFGPHEGPPAPAPSPPGTFRATPQQLKTLTVEVVQTHGFVSEELTEGKIAVNGDRATPVFSPYSGRVTRVIAGLGDTVRPGAPLATLEASEYVQAQSDLKASAAAVKLARINETRKHALYDAKGGSLQDWQSAQADLTNAESAHSAVRNRLRILGKSDAQITELERAEIMNPVAILTAPIAGVVVDRQVGPGQYLQAAELLENLGPGNQHADEIERLNALLWLRGKVSDWPDEAALRKRIDSDPKNAAAKVDPPPTL